MDGWLLWCQVKCVSSREVIEQSSQLLRAIHLFGDKMKIQLSNNSHRFTSGYRSERKYRVSF